MNAGREKCDQEKYCRVCKSTCPEAAHLWPRSLGAKGYENPDLIVPLCKPCHEEFDAHHLELLPHLKRIEEISIVTMAGLSRAYKRVVAQAYDEF